MTKSTLLDLLSNGDKENCNYFLNLASNGGDDLIRFLNDLLYYSILIKWDERASNHPVITINSIKNLISDNRTNPSKVLLSFCIQILLGMPIRKNDVVYLNEIEKEGIDSSIFAGELEDKIQSGDWVKAKNIAAKMFLASDKSRAVIDVISDLGLQNIDCNGLFIFHLLRAFNFQQKQSQTWEYACCLIEILKSHPLSKPHSRKNITPQRVFENIPHNFNIELWVNLSAMIRIWDNDYVRQNSYKREISSWLYYIDIEQKDFVNFNPENKKINYNFIKIAESMIKKEIDRNKISQYINKLDALRFISKVNSEKSSKIINFHLSQMD